MKIHRIRPGYLLKTSNGKCVCVQREYSDNESHQLIAENVQENDPRNTGKVTVYDIEYDGGKKSMAFCFEVENKAIFPAVAENKFKCEELSVSTKTTFPDKPFLFEWGERGTSDWRSLRSVADPSKYLFLEENINANPKVTINPTKMPDFKIEKNKSSEDAEKLKLESTRQHVNSTRSRRLCFMSRESNQQTFYCDPTVLSIKSTYRPKRKIKKIKMPVKSRMPQQQDPDQMSRNRRADDSFMVL